MNNKSKPFFRADHVGSLLRPDAIKNARQAYLQGKINASQLREKENEAIAHLAKAQLEAGLIATTDGELRRQNWWVDFISAIPGIKIESPVEADSFSPSMAGNSPHIPLNVTVRAPIRFEHSLMEQDYRDLAAASDGMPKITIPSPSRIHFHAGDAVANPDVYSDSDAMWADIIAFYQAEIKALEAAGCQYIQIDDPIMSYFVDKDHRARMGARGMEPDSTLKHYVDVINACIAERSENTYLSLHICRGNARSTWAASGGYQAIAPIVFPHLKVDALFLEYDDDRSGDFAPLTFLDQQNVVLGLLTSKLATLEPRDLVLARIEEASHIIPLDRLALSPQCGFASTEEGNLLSETDQWNKLKYCADIAKEVWGDIRA